MLKSEKKHSYALDLLDPRFREDDSGGKGGDDVVLGEIKWKNIFGFIFWQVSVTGRYISELRTIYRGAFGNIEKGLLKGLLRIMMFIGSCIMKIIQILFQRLRGRSSLRNGIAHGKKNLSKIAIHNGLICMKASTIKRFFSLTFCHPRESGDPVGWATKFHFFNKIVVAGRG